MEIVLTDRVTGGWLTATCTAGLMVSGEAGLDTDIAGTDDGGGTGWTFVTVVDLGGAGFMGGTFMDDIITTGGAEAAAGAVFTTTAELVLGGSEKTRRMTFEKYILNTY